MTVTVEDGTGLADSDVYATILTVDNYLLGSPYATAWTDAVEAAQEWALRTATILLDTQVTWRGDPLTTTQALAWPRKNTDPEVTGIPVWLERATAEQALALLQVDRTSDNQVPGVGQIERVKVDMVEIEYAPTGRRTSPASVMTPAALRLIPGSLHRGQSGSFKAISLVRG